VDNKETRPTGSPTPTLAPPAVITVGSGLILLAALALGLLLLVIGSGTRSRAVTLIGDFVFPLSLFGGGLFWAEEHLAVRIALIALGGLFAIAVFGSISPL
jgi:hypothetical protein